MNSKLDEQHMTYCTVWSVNKNKAKEQTLCVKTLHDSKAFRTTFSGNN